MAVNNYEHVWHNGKFIPWGEATIHVSAHVVHYASCLFEGIRCYDTPHGPAIFRVNEHTDRLVNSAKIYRMDLPYTREQLARRWWNWCASTTSSTATCARWRFAAKAKWESIP